MAAMIEQQLAKLLEGTSDAAFTVDLLGEIRTWNRGAEKLFGYPAAATVGKYCGSLIGGATSPAFQVCRLNCDVLDCARKGQELPNFDMEVNTRSGKRIWVNASLLVASNPQTQKRLVVHFMRNIGNRKRTEDLTNRIMEVAVLWLSESAEADSRLPPATPLTEQERRILTLLAAGKSSKDLAANLGISARTLRNHTSHINQKLHTRNRLEAVIQAMTRKLI